MTSRCRKRLASAEAAVGALLSANTLLASLDGRSACVILSVILLFVVVVTTRYFAELDGVTSVVGDLGVMSVDVIGVACNLSIIK